MQYGVSRIPGQDIGARTGYIRQIDAEAERIGGDGVIRHQIIPDIRRVMPVVITIGTVMIGDQEQPSPIMDKIENGRLFSTGKKDIRLVHPKDVIMGTVLCIGGAATSD